jgi:hypothetical protein
MPVSMPRIVATWLVLGAASGLAAGCGGSRSVIAEGETISASPPIAKPLAIAYARAVNLRASDVPEMGINSSEGEAPSPKRSALEFARCYGGVSPERRVVGIHSPEFTSGRATQSKLVESESEVMPTPGLAARNNAANRSSRERACFVDFQEAFNKQRNKQRARQLLYGPSTVSPLPNPLPGVNGSFGRRTATVLLRGRQIYLRIYKDVFGFVYGPAEITLRATGFSRPVPSKTEQRLLLLLYHRARHMCSKPKLRAKEW